MIQSKIDHIGETNIAKNGLKMTIIGYRNYRDVDAEFEDGYIAYHKNYRCFKEGTIKNPNVKISRPKKPNNRVGTTVMQHCDMEATCIAYRTTEDSDFEFKDGAIVEHRKFYQFMRGSLLNPNLKNTNLLKANKKRLEIVNNKYKEKTFETKYGMTYKVIEFISRKEVLIEFNDGYQMIVQAQRVGSSIKRPDLLIVSKNGRSTIIKIGDTRLMKCGLKATIIEAKSSNDITVKFENGVIKEHVRFSLFEQGRLTDIKSTGIRIFVGDKFINSEGEEFEVIEKKKNISIVKFSDGTIRDVETKRIKNGMNLPKFKTKFHSDKTIGAIFNTNCGLKCKVLRWKKKNTVDVEYEDGSVKEDINIQALKKGQVAHPDLQFPHGHNMFYGYDCQRAFEKNGKVYYAIFDTEENVIGIMTPQEMIETRK